MCIIYIIYIYHICCNMCYHPCIYILWHSIGWQTHGCAFVAVAEIISQSNLGISPLLRLLQPFPLPKKKTMKSHDQPTVWHQKIPEKIPTFQVFNRCFPQSLHPPNPTPKSDKSPIFDAGIPEVMSRSLKANWWFGAPWFGIRIGGTPKNPNPFHFRGSPKSKPPGPQTTT